MSDYSPARPRHFPRLAPRELEVLRYFARGLTYDQIARRMGLTRHTVDTYLRRIRTKTGSSSAAHLTRLAVALEEPPAAPGAAAAAADGGEAELGSEG